MASLDSSSLEVPRNAVPASVTAAVMAIGQETLPLESFPAVQGVDFNKEVTLADMVTAMGTTGFQATELSRAVDEINRMRAWRLSDEPIKGDELDEELKDPEVRKKTKCTIFLGYTSNMISSGVRETIRYLCQHNLVDCLVTTAGGIEEDIMKCILPHHLGDFEKYKGAALRMRGINRIGNLLVPNANYCAFEEFVTPILEKMHDEQDASNGELVWTPSKLIDRFGQEVDNEESVYYWCHKNKIPVFCPAITDGSVGDMLYFQSYKRGGFHLDIVQDVRALNDIAVKAHASGMVIVGGGLVKHHICNANLMRNGANFSVFINTSHAFDGSDGGAPADEAVSWGKIRLDATPVKVSCDATIAFPLIVSQTFAKDGPKAPIKIKAKKQEAAPAADGGAAAAGALGAPEKGP